MSVEKSTPETREKSIESLSKKELLILVVKLQDTIVKMQEEISELKRRVNMNSSNSSKPSSTNGYKKPDKKRSLKGKSDKKRGGQKWHKGATLRPYEKPDSVEVLEIEDCVECGNNLRDIPMINIKKRQVVDIPEPIYFVLEYQWWEKQCPCCQSITKSVFPPWVVGDIQIWPNIKAHSAYFYNYGMIWYQRIQELLKEFYGLDISQTSLMKFNKEGYENLESVSLRIRNAIKNSSVANGDETGVRVDKSLYWIHVASTKLFTDYLVDPKRWQEALDKMGILIEFIGILVHDHWLPYFSYSGCIHALCHAHHLRELIAILQNETVSWAESMKSFLIDMQSKKEVAMKKGIDRFDDDTLLTIRTEYRQIIAQGQMEYPEPVRKEWQRGKLKKSKGHNLLIRFRDYEDANLQFLYDFSVPFDNNLAERDLRMIKVRTKVSGCFRSLEWAEWFCRIRGYISTMRKQGFPIYQAMKSIFEGEVLSPNFECT